VDVLVVGGGAAGVAAATTAGEAGKLVLLVERYGFCGGAAVAGLSGTICGFYKAHENRHEPEQVVFGFSERFKQELQKKGGITAPQLYGKTYTHTHDPLKWSESAEHLLLEAGVRILFHTVVSGVIMDNEDCRGVILESNAGRSIVYAKRIVDASGDAAVIARAGYRHVFGDQGRIQNPTMIFRLGNVNLEEWRDYYGEDTISPPKLVDAIKLAHDSGRYTLPRHKIWLFPTTQPHELLVNATRLSGHDGRFLNVIDPVDFTEAEISGRRQVREYARFFADNMPGCKDSYVVATGTEVGIRQTRSIIGIETLTNDDVITCHKRTDGICRVPWPIELHSGNMPKLHWLIDDYYEVPYGTLVPEAGENIIAAGRCLSAEHEALASARVTAQCFEYGHAAGQAALLSLATGRRFRDIPGEEIRAHMARHGSAL